MTKKLPLLAVVFFAAGLLFTACPVFDSPPSIEWDGVYDRTSVGNQWGLYDDIVVTVYWFDNRIVFARIEHQESPEFAPRPLGNFVAYLVREQHAPPYLAPNVDGAGWPSNYFDAFSGGTMSVNYASLAAVEAGVTRR